MGERNPEPHTQRGPTRRLKPTRWDPVCRWFKSPDGTTLTEQAAEAGILPAPTGEGTSG